MRRLTLFAALLLTLPGCMVLIVVDESTRPAAPPTPTAVADTTRTPPAP